MYGVVASLLVALLFGGIHLVVGPYTAAAAFILGAIAGEFRRRSGSLIPAIICHAFFNLGGIIWT
jgi:membrane protease YdiL (CAAX protease family)